MFRRLLLGAALILATASPVSPAAGAPAEPAWSLRYFFNAVFGGATSFELDAKGRYVLIATSFRFPRSERNGTLRPAELAPFVRLVATARTVTWSSSYSGYHACVEHYSSLRFVRRGEGRPDEQTVTWGCGLPGVPADLRALIHALRAQVTAFIADAPIDTMPTLEAVPVFTHDAMWLVTGDGARSVSIAADGTLAGRRRTIVALYPVADCPPRALGAVEPPALLKLHALLTPTADVFLGTSRETAETFARAMSDCGAPAGFGYAAPEYIVPRATRWIVKTILADERGTVDVDVDDAGRALVRRNPSEPARKTLARATVTALDRLISNLRDDEGPRSFPGADGCEQIVQITVIAADGARRNGAPFTGSCDPAGAPPAVTALFHFVRERVVPEIGS